MRKLPLVLLSTCLLLLGTTQAQNLQATDTIADATLYWKAMQDDLYDVGIKLEKNALKINEESKRVLQDSMYRQTIFPETYSFADAANLLKQMQLKKAFWFFIKLYQQHADNRQMVMQSLIPFDKTMDMDKVLISTFYTYALLDTKVCSITNNKVMVTRPDVLEKQFTHVKEMIAIIRNNREPLAGR